MKHRNPHSLPTYIISLDSDQERRKHAIAQFADISFLKPRFFEAIDAHAENFDFGIYRDLSRGKWGVSNVFKPGAWGCYLSHMNCWKAVSKDDHDAALIVEDDAVLEKDRLVELMTHKLPSGFDVIFINFGVARFVKLLDSSFSSDIQNFFKLNDVVMHLLSKNLYSNDLNPGTYGYLISKKGAKKLCRIVMRDRISMGVDYAMLFASLNSDDIDRIAGKKQCPSYLENYLKNLREDGHFHNKSKRETLNSYVCSDLPAFNHSKTFDSSIDHKKFLPFTVFD